MNLIQTDKISLPLRERGIDIDNQRLLITIYSGSEQEKDLTQPPNCDGVGRLRHFRRKPASLWENPLPIDPVLKSLKKAKTDEIVAQVFQNAICNWRCWYCFVDFSLLSANPKHSRWFSAKELVHLFENQPHRADMIDLSGGQPDLTPEWSIWMADALVEAGLSDDVYLWSDDNLSNDYFERYLTTQQIDRLLAYPHYGRVACFKGIDSESFSFNTLAEPALFERQFSIFNTLYSTGMDLYAYVTFTSPTNKNLKDKVNQFLDKLQIIHPNLPLRTVPLRIDIFSPVKDRMNDQHFMAMEYQEIVIKYWREGLKERFDSSMRDLSIADVSLSSPE